MVSTIESVTAAAIYLNPIYHHIDFRPKTYLNMHKRQLEKKAKQRIESWKAKMRLYR